ncbi:MAG TPA: glycine cleavage T C-terminal barrel domain-containing protein [Longimicrobiaceae bacterium]|nr:glycine cleavage T C-terminal barrel domain-containing protein [Longimicrobiaceae bacterium]
MTELREMLEARGAVFTDVAGAEVPRHFGDGSAEYRAVREVAGVALRGDRALVRMWGRDPVKMVQGLVTNDLAGAPAGQGVYAAMLTPKGRTIAEMRIFRRELATGVEVLIDLPREALEGTRDHLKKFVPPMFARWADASQEMGVVGVYGPRAREVTGRALGREMDELGEDAFVEATFDGEPVMVAGTRAVGGEEGYEVFASAALPAVWRAMADASTDVGGRPVGFGALETLRIEAGRPRYGSDITDETIPTEAYESTGLLNRAISFTKGCYTGQEVIIRIAHRGHVNRHLRGLLLGDGPAPAARSPLHHPETGKDVGRITSVAFSPLLGQTVALGYVRREVEPGATVRVGAPDGPPATVAHLPFTAETGDA